MKRFALLLVGLLLVGCQDAQTYPQPRKIADWPSGNGLYVIEHGTDRIYFGIGYVGDSITVVPQPAEPQAQKPAEPKRPGRLRPGAKGEIEY